MLWIPYKTNMPTWLPLSSSKGSSSWLSWIVFYQGIPLFRRTCKTPRCTKTHFKGSRLGPRSYYTKTYFVVLLLTIPKLSLHFLQVFWLGSKIKFTDRTIWSLHPVYVHHYFIHYIIIISDNEDDFETLIYFTYIPNIEKKKYKSQGV